MSSIPARSFMMGLLTVLLTVLACQKKPEKKPADLIGKKTPNTANRQYEQQSPTDFPEDLMGISNLEELLQNLGLKRYHELGFHGQNLKIAIFDNGYAGLKFSLGKRLPPNTKLMPSAKPEMQDTSHGTKMAEIVYALMSGSTTYDKRRPGPQIQLYNTNGYTNFTTAIDTAIREKVDVILYAQVWEFGGNLDGQGFINKEVNRATSRNILWVNAAGNFGKTTFNGPVLVAHGSGARSVVLPNESRYVRFTVPQDDTPTKIVLSWNDFDESKDYRTRQDLDLILESSNGKEIAVSRLLQDGSGLSQTASISSKSNQTLTADQTQAAQQDVKRSAHAREIIMANLAAGTYRLRVEAKSDNFDAQSSLRMTIDAIGARMLDTSTQESLLVPADNSTVIAMGASDVDYSSWSDNLVRSKPELMAHSEIRFEGGQSVRGTSAATAIGVAALSIFKSARGVNTLQDMLDEISSGSVATRDPVLCQSARQLSGLDPCARAPILRLMSPDNLPKPQS